jgi:hypothetical protein
MGLYRSLSLARIFTNFSVLSTSDFSAGDGIQGLAHARKALYQLNYSPSFYFFFFFFWAGLVFELRVLHLLVRCSTT